MLLTIISATIAVDYCSKDICSAQNHIGCENTGGFGPSCPAERSVVPMTADIIALILQRHNTARANIANGRVSPFSKANRMIQMVSKRVYSKWRKCVIETRPKGEPRTVLRQAGVDST